jgi:hypothetical protein
VWHGLLESAHFAVVAYRQAQTAPHRAFSLATIAHNQAK